MDLLASFRSSLDSLVIRSEGRNYRKECGYPEVITVGDYHNIYLRNGLCQRIVNLMPDECAQSQAQVQELDSGEDETPWESDFQDHANAVNLWHYIQQTDRLAGIGRFGILLLGFNDGQTLDKPVKKVAGMEIMYLRAFSEAHAAIESYETNETSSRFGKPLYYTLQFSDIYTESSTQGESAIAPIQTKRVHWSRCIHFSDSGETLSAPRLEKTWNWSHIDMAKLAGGGAEMFWRGAFPGMFFNIDPSVQMDTTKADEIKTTSWNYFNTLTRIMHMQGVTVTQLKPQIADPSSQFRMLLQLIAISENCPLAVLTGDQQGGLGDGVGLRGADEWALRKQTRRERYLGPGPIRAYVERCIEYGILKPAEFTAIFPNPSNLTEEQIAATGLVWVKAMAEYIKSGADSLVPPLSLLTEFFKMDMERAKRIVGAAEEYAASIAAQQPEDLLGIEGPEATETPTAALAATTSPGNTKSPKKATKPANAM